ncbi:MAG: hypothetical protein ACRDNZ_05825 [Streptosporangiaceae bacterium]
MMRLYDIRLGQVTDIEPARRRLLRLAVTGTDQEPGTIHCAGPAGLAGPAGRAHLGDLRTYLVGDLIRRNAERRNLVVQASHSASRADGAELGLRPPDEARLDGPVDIQVGGSEPGDLARHWTAAGPVLFDEPAPGEPPAGEPPPAGERPPGERRPGELGGSVRLDDLAERGLDPLALRLAFLRHPYRDELRLSWAALTAAQQALQAIRAHVADWATRPSRPLSASHAAQVHAAFDDDLATPRALATLRELAGSTQVPPGAKFETFAHLDQLLGLDLAREIGRY